MFVVTRTADQINRMTSWIDGSFVYSISEAWVNAMRSFENGTFKTGESEGMPPRNKDRVPLFTAPAPHVMRMTNPERMLRKLLCPAPVDTHETNQLTKKTTNNKQTNHGVTRWVG